MFEDLEPIAPDAILGLTADYRADPRADKVNLTVGVYQDENEQTYVPPSVRGAIADLAGGPTSPDYLPIPGTPEFALAVRGLLFGEGELLDPGGRAVTVHTPGGTGGLRVAADFLRLVNPSAEVWFSEPTWPNHPGVFSAARLESRRYPYFDAQSAGLRREAFLAALREIPAGDVVVLHGCCHNPTGVDPDYETWLEVAAISLERGWLPLVDLAYQGLGSGPEEDVAGLRALAARVPELIVCNSFSKILGLYNERVGALTLVATDPAAADAAGSLLRNVVRTNYSNPPAHGGAIVSLVLGEESRRQAWRSELETMRQRLVAMRSGLAAALVSAGAQRDFSFLTRQNGLFSLLGLSPEEVGTLREDRGIYLVTSGRINVAGLSSGNLERVAEAIVAVGG